MKDLGRIRGALAWNTPVFATTDAVYLNTNIEIETIVDEMTGEEREECVFDCVQYTPEEYTALLTAENSELRTSLTTVENELTDAQIALADVYEMITGGE